MLLSRQSAVSSLGYETIDDACEVSMRDACSEGIGATLQLENHVSM